MDLKNNLENKYIAYLDVLGFKELVYSKQTDKLETYFTAIRETLDDLKYEKKSIKSLLVSDSTILVSPDSSEDFKVLLLAVQTIQSRLALKDIWIRGAICYGEVYYDDLSNIIVGKGLIDAYLLEQEAKYPRVIINTSIIPRIAANSQEFLLKINPPNENSGIPKMKLVHNWFKYIQSDSYFVSYGHRIVHEAMNDRSLNDIHKIILENLYSSQKNYEKYLWVKNYFLDVIHDIDDWTHYRVSPENTAQKDYIKEWFGKFAEI